MIRFFLLSNLVLALSVGAAIGHPVHADELEPAERLKLKLAETVSFVESALVEPMPDLEKRARKGYARDKLMYGLALKAGRMGPGQEKNAKKWIRNATNSFERPTYSQSNLIGPASKPARDLEAKRYSRGVAIPSTPIGGRAPLNSMGYTYPTFTSMSRDTILVAEACVAALLIAPDPEANVFACGGETEYQRLLALMPK
ncbi:hypothetical protein Q1W73_05930 [Asticcacaulis sp. ZE23SCel15]|uniref:hypothetical protein n=1 Tax=Asticcacaulis sp. ZE23SCel15 TaxID=3059027 RepID=UPI00265D8CC5|nr:hypothetical protein [Asticcacaulis sp. ZE23SCel15]WKL58523.1 hypothetical protein Q1W73_05930 [Asticcacaulis sp. ZE23SCel15]